MSDRSESGNTRRDFLRGKLATSPVSNLDEAVESSQASPVEPGMLLRLGRPAMACEWDVYLNAGQYENGQAAAIEALDLVEQLESQMTVYSDDSEVSRINFDATEMPVAVEPNLFELLERGVELYRITDGAFDMTAGPFSKLWGFSRREGRVPDSQALSQALEMVGSNHVKLNPEERTVEFACDGVELNLGAIGKGYALDQCADLLVEQSIDDFLIHGGQSSILARGRRQGEERSWSVGIRHPLRPERRLAEVVLDGRALGTSGTAAQSFFHQGRRYGHILDPRTGMPAEGMLSTSVVAPTAAEADALATAFYVMGIDDSLKFLEQHDQIGAILVAPGERQGGMRLEIAGIADDDLLMLDE